MSKYRDESEESKMAAGAFADSVALESSAGKQQTEANQGNHVSAPYVLQALQRQASDAPIRSFYTSHTKQQRKG